MQRQKRIRVTEDQLRVAGVAARLEDASYQLAAILDHPPQKYLNVPMVDCAAHRLDDMAQALLKAAGLPSREGEHGR